MRTRMSPTARIARSLPRLRWLCSATAAFSMLQSLVTPALPIIQRELHTTPATVTWVLTAWLLSAAVATPLLGRIGDLAGKKRTLLIALGAVVLGCLIAALAPEHLRAHRRRAWCKVSVARSSR